MKKMIMSLLLLCGGCISQRGHFALIDLDFRKPEQIRENVKELEVIYGYKDKTPEKEEEVSQKSITTGFWNILMETLCKLQCKITIFQLRWNNDAQISK